MTKKLAQKILKVDKKLKTCEAMDPSVCMRHYKENQFIMDVVCETGIWWAHFIRQAKDKLNERRNRK